eukprot:6384770-Pyramimonas_sp.AAC.1
MDDSATSRDLDPPKDPDFKKVVFCSGKIYYELAAERARLGLQKVRFSSPVEVLLTSDNMFAYPGCCVRPCRYTGAGGPVNTSDARRLFGLQELAICRVEQLSPFPFDLVARELRRYPNAKVQWCQEEPMNMGAWTY